MLSLQSASNNDHCPFEIDVDGEKTEMVMESTSSEGEVLENWFIIIKLCHIKIQDL